METGRDQSDAATGERKLEEARKFTLLESSEEEQPYQHLEFRLRASQTLIEYISVVLSHPVSGALLRQA